MAKQNKLRQCRHTDCTRLSDPQDNNRGFCNKCIQLNTRRCNYCLPKGYKDSEPRKSIWNQNIKDVPLIKMVLIIVGVVILGFILGFAIIRVVLKSIAGLVLFLLLIMAAYFIIKYFSNWFD